MPSSRKSEGSPGSCDLPPVDVFVDVDGVLLRSAKRGPRSSSAIFVRDLPDPIPVPSGSLPTARQSWSGAPIEISPEAKMALEALAAFARVRILSAHPPWSSFTVLGAIGAPSEILPLGWSGTQLCKAEVASRYAGDRPWVMIDDNPGSVSVEWLHEHGHRSQLALPEDHVGITMSHVRWARSLLEPGIPDVLTA